MPYVPRSIKILTRTYNTKGLKQFLTEVEIAIKDEKEGIEFYKKMAKKHAEFGTIFLELAAEEQVHLDKLNIFAGKIKSAIVH
jgi:rubrerythrin